MSLAVVFGGSGFLGSHVADALQDAGHEVRICDLADSPWRREGQDMVRCDILDPEAVAEAVNGADYVYNFAGLADIDEARHKPIDTVRLNVLGNTHILEGCRLAGGVRRYVFASTVYVYSERGGFYRGLQAGLGADNRGLPGALRPGAHHPALRLALRTPGRRPQRHLPHPALSALADGAVTYQGTGEEQREYIHVADAARLSVRILDPEFANQHVILTGPYPYKVRDLMDMIREMLGNRPEIRFLNEPLAGHYKITPYAFLPKVGRKLVGDSYTDMGQGLLDCLAELNEKLSRERD